MIGALFKLIRKLLHAGETPEPEYVLVQLYTSQPASADAVFFAPGFWSAEPIIIGKGSVLEEGIYQLNSGDEWPIRRDIFVDGEVVFSRYESEHASMGLNQTLHLADYRTWVETGRLVVLESDK